MSIPSSYTSHLSPVSSAKLHALVSCAIDKEKVYRTFPFYVEAMLGLSALLMSDSISNLIHGVCKLEPLLAPLKHFKFILCVSLSSPKGLPSSSV